MDTPPTGGATLGVGGQPLVLAKLQLGTVDGHDKMKLAVGTAPGVLLRVGVRGQVQPVIGRQIRFWLAF